jgi:L-amino acid N-acyltransferase YncA
VSPAALANGRAIHVHIHTALGFKPVGVLRSCERVAEGVWRDVLLIDLLAEDFVRE